MRIIMTLLVKNEADIVRDNIDFHLKCGVSHIIATDNGSTDGTREILEEYAKRGVVTLLDEPGNDYSQWRWVTKMALLARDHYKADWIINNDADEFWWHPGLDLVSPLLNCSADMLDCRRFNMVFPLSHNDRRDWRKRAIYRAANPTPIQCPQDPLRDRLEHPYFLHNLPGKALVKAKGVRRIAQGNHSAEFEHTHSVESGPFIVFHFPVRSAQQFEIKILQGGAAYSRNKELPTQMGWHWRRWYRLLQKQGLIETLKEVFPSGEYLASGLGDGSIIVDTRMQNELDPINQQNRDVIVARPMQISN